MVHSLEPNPNPDQVWFGSRVVILARKRWEYWDYLRHHRLHEPSDYVNFCDCREAMLAKKRREYRDYLPQFYDVAPSERTEDETSALRQVLYNT